MSKERKKKETESKKEGRYFQLIAVVTATKKMIYLHIYRKSML